MKAMEILLYFILIPMAPFCMWGGERSMPFIIEGFGANTIGGKGGKIYDVTSLDDSNERGSLRWAVEKRGPRIIRFKVSGILKLKSELEIVNPYITIDGSLDQRDLNDGVTITNYPISIKTDEVIIRYIRVRRGDVSVLEQNKRSKLDRPKGSRGLDCINIDESRNVVIDHVSASWSADEIFSVTNSQNVTVQWSLISEPLSNWHIHPYGDEHAYASNNSASTVTYHHNIFYGFILRGPQFEANDNKEDQRYDAQFESINNLIYGYEQSGIRYKSSFKLKIDIVKNINIYYHIINNLFMKPIKNTAPEITVETYYGTAKNVKVFVKGNIGPNRKSERDNEYSLVIAKDPKTGKLRPLNELKEFYSQAVFKPLFESPRPVTLNSATSLYPNLLNLVGCTGNRIKRDKIDNRVLTRINNREPAKILTSQKQVEGFNINQHF